MISIRYTIHQNLLSADGWYARFEFGVVPLVAWVTADVKAYDSDGRYIETQPTEVVGLVWNGHRVIPAPHASGFERYFRESYTS